jgi:hypothetical protein
VIRVVLEMCSVIAGGMVRPDTTMASGASHLLVGMTTQSAFNRQANPLATSFHFAGIVEGFIHLADICRLWVGRQAFLGAVTPMLRIGAARQVRDAHSLI